VTAVVVVATALFSVAALLTLIRAERGPSMLDRTVALDVLTSIVLGVVALYAAWTRQADAVPVLVALALVGFVSSVTIARFAAVEPEGIGRVLTRDEVAAMEAQQRAEEEAEREGFDDEHRGGPAEGGVAE
jgi:multicomponent Na+:H+ antiporter subunit F